MNHQCSRREILKRTGASLTLLGKPNALDQRALEEIATRDDSVGLDILYSQNGNNYDQSHLPSENRDP
jgi:hypothetical protein